MPEEYERLLSMNIPSEPYQFTAIRFPRCNLLLVRHSEVDCINHDTVPTSLLGRCRRRDTIGRIQEALVIAAIMFTVESSRETKVRKFDMTIFINQDIVRLDITGTRVVRVGKPNYG